MSTSPVEELGRVSFEVMGRLAQVAAQEDMSLTQLRMLAILRDRQPRMAELADALGVDRSSVSGLIRRAEQRGLVTRHTAAHDGRGISVSLTPAGQAFTEPLADRIADALAPLLTRLDSGDRIVLESLLAKVGAVNLKP